MAVKLEPAKGYDRLHWPFIHEMFLEARFPQMMVEVIISCVSSPQFNILWNGAPSEQFTPSRGVRQGDPLLPYLFVLCMQRLSHLIEEEVAKRT